MFTLGYVIGKAVGGTQGAAYAQLRLEADAENRVVSTQGRPDAELAEARPRSASQGELG
jgi:hypothetical protein